MIKLTNCKVLVTGGAGFIGSHLVHRLVELGADVTVLDNLSTGKKENLADNINRITFIQGDITDQRACMEATKHQQIIFHLAAHISVPESVENPLKTFNTNITGTANMLEAARRHNIERYILASSSAVYGEKSGPCKELDICNPSSPYGYSKLIGEQLVQQYHHIFNIHTVSLRFFNVWGERQNPEGAYAGVVAKFKDRMKKNLPITIFGDGTQTRDFISVHEVIESILTITGLPLALLQGQPINIASGKSISLLELVEKLQQEFPNYTEKIVFQTERKGDIKHSTADCSTYQALKKLSPEFIF